MTLAKNKSKVLIALAMVMIVIALPVLLYRIKSTVDARVGKILYGIFEDQASRAAVNEWAREVILSLKEGQLTGTVPAPDDGFVFETSFRKEGHSLARNGLPHKLLRPEGSSHFLFDKESKTITLPSIVEEKLIVAGEGLYATVLIELSSNEITVLLNRTQGFIVKLKPHVIKASDPWGSYIVKQDDGFAIISSD